MASSHTWTADHQVSPYAALDELQFSCSTVANILTAQPVPTDIAGTPRAPRESDVHTRRPLAPAAHIVRGDGLGRERPRLIVENLRNLVPLHP